MTTHMIPRDFIRELRADPNTPEAEVTLTVAKTIEYSDPKRWLKVEVHVKLSCDQTAHQLDNASAIAFEKAEEYSEKAMRHYHPEGE